MMPEYLFAAIIESQYIPAIQPFPAAPSPNALTPNLPPILAPSCYPQVATAYFLPAPPSAPKITVLSPGSYPSSIAPTSSCPSNNLGLPPPSVYSPSIPSVLPVQPVSPPPVSTTLQPVPATVLAPPVYLPPSPSIPVVPSAAPTLPVPPVCSPPTQPSLPAPPVCLASTPPPLPASAYLDPVSPTVPTSPVCLSSKSPPCLPVLSDLKRQTSGFVPPPEESCIIEEKPLFRPPPTSGPVYPGIFDGPPRVPENNLRFDQDVLRGFLVSLGI